MSEREQDKVWAFDTLFTNNHIQKLKILMPYFDRPMQKNMAVYIKFLELQYTLNFFRRYPSADLGPLPREDSMDISKLCDEMIPYCTQSERSQMENMQNMFRTFENYKEMMEMVQMMKEMFPEGENPMSSMFGGMDMSQMPNMSQMPSMSQMPDMSQMMDMFQMFNSFNGGDSDHGNNE